MTKLSPREFFDDFDHITQIRKILSRKRYMNTFSFLVSHFNHNHATKVTIAEVQYATGNFDRNDTHQIMDGFVILNLLEKKKIGNRVFFVKNDTWWEVAQKEVDDGGTEHRDPD